MRTFAKAFFVPLFIAAAMLAAMPANADKSVPEYPFQDTSLPVEARVADLVSRLTLEEKASLMNDDSAAVPRFGIKEYKYWNEALHGVARAGKFTVFPQASGIASTWNPELVEKLATVISDEAWGAMNRDMAKTGYPSNRFLTFWSPVINMARDPRWGRTPETYGEDPFLASSLAVPFVRGLQGYDKRYIKVVATPKHFAANNEEHNRTGGGATVSERSLREYYFPAFKDTVEAGAQSIMGAYNSINGIPCNANKWLLTDVLKNDWKFDGFVVTDCGAMNFMITDHKYAKSGPEATAFAINAGVDVECGGEFVIAKNLVAAVKSGLLTEEKVNESIADLLRVRMRLGMFDPPEMNPYTKISPSVIGAKEHMLLARRTSQESIVLLKNGKTGGKPALPLDARKIKTIAITGPFADVLEYGDYSGTPANTPVTILDGIKAKSKGKIKIKHIAWNPIPRNEGFIPVPLKALGGETAVKAEFFTAPGFKGNAAATAEVEYPAYKKADLPAAPQFDEGALSIRWSGTITAPRSGVFMFKAEASGSARFALGGKTLLSFKDIVEKPKKQSLKSGESFSINNAAKPVRKLRRITLVFMKKGQQYPFTFEYTPADKKPAARLDWAAPDKDMTADEFAALRDSDVVIAAMGYAGTDEIENIDRFSLDLPEGQTSFVLALSEINPRIVLTLTNGSPLALNELDKKIPAILETWNPGEQGGAAIADVLFGDYNPAGRMPFTSFKSLDDLPAFNDYEVYNGRTYMYFKGEPLYPFGYGLSYTTFAYSGLSVAANKKSPGRIFTASLKVRNTGSRDGGEVVQLYARKIKGDAKTPLKKLVGFKRMNIKKGKTENISITFDAEDLSRWDETLHKFVFDPGEYEIMAAASASDIQLRKKIKID